MQRSVMFYVICIASQAVIDIRYSTFERERSSKVLSWFFSSQYEDKKDSAFPANSAEC